MKVKINQKEVIAKEGETILELAKRENIEIPFLCNHPDVKVTGSCRICVVNVVGQGIKTACSTKLTEGMELETVSPEIEKIRKINLELLFSQHKEECHDCVWYPDCKLLSLAKKYNVEINRFTDRKSDYPELRFGGIIDFDSSKCIDCRNCVEVCDRQRVQFLELEEKEDLYEVEPSKERSCVYCGQCILHCPAGAFESVGEFENILEWKNKDKQIIFQIAPSVRVGIGEEFGFSPGTVSTKKMITGLKMLGADKVFDTTLGADFTTIEESKELLEKLKQNDLPLFTSCCPAWVRFVEVYYPEFKKNLTTVRSPQIILGSVIKDLYKDSIVVSVMPCVSKKYEITREEIVDKNGKSPVDYVLTTREVGRLFRKFDQIPETEDFDLLGDSSGDGLAYGVSGGVLVAALKQVYYMKTGKKFDKKIDNSNEFSVQIEDKEIKVKRVSGLDEAKKVLDTLKESPNYYDYIEFMACPGGCVGGGGQPVPSSKKIIQKRREGLLDVASKRKLESAFENDAIAKICQRLKEKDLFHTSYSQKENPEKIDTI